MEAATALTCTLLPAIEPVTLVSPPALQLLPRTCCIWTISHVPAPGAPHTALRPQACSTQVHRQ